PGRNIDSQFDSKIRTAFYRLIQPSIFSRIVTSPHPVCRKRHTGKSVFNRSKNHIRQSLSNRLSRTSNRVNQSRQRRMPDSCRYAFFSFLFYCHYAYVVQRQLYSSSTLLLGYFFSHAYVHFKRQPVFTSIRF